VGDLVSYNRILCTCFGLLLIASATARASESPEETSGRIPFRLYKNYLIVAQGSLGKLKKRNFLIDTGANPTVLDEQVAQQLGVKPLPDSAAAVGVFSGSVNSRFAMLPSLQLGPLRARDLRVAIADLSELNSRVGVRVDAIVGVDVLGQSSFQIDYERKQMVFGPIDFDSSAVSFGEDGMFATVPATIEDRSVRVMVDTGSAGLVLFANRIGEWQQRLPLAGMARMRGLGGIAPMPVVLLDHIQVGNWQLGSRHAYIARQVACCRFDGVIGVSALRVKQISFDFRNRLVSWQLRDREIPSMSESTPANCMPVSAPGLTTPGRASMFSRERRANACDFPAHSN
jgi:predicted aspartyl protease